MTQPADSGSIPLSIGSWVYSPSHGESVRILDVETIWNHTVCQVWIPRMNTVERLAADALAAQEQPRKASLDRVVYAAAAARIADALTQDVLLAPLEAGVIPLPHQLHALTRAVTGDRVRYLLADEVGLGKTTEAGLIFRELKLRGLVKRVLVVAPKGLVPQWVQEMQTHFGEEFRLLIPSEFSAWRNLTGVENVWRQFDQVVCPADSIKPIERRRGWSRQKLEAYNQERLGDLIDAGWDLIICDEAHRLGGSTEQVARYRLGRALAEAAPYLLLLDLARRCQAHGPDARAETLLDILYDNQRDENNPALKYLIFTEFVPTQNMLHDFLEQHGFPVVCLNGSMDLEERRRVQLRFAERARILVSTDAGGEGLNLQFAHIVINYDLPWNPMRIEQRIGRVDRIGQKLPVKALNLIFENSVELRVQEVLEDKLATILTPIPCVRFASLPAEVFGYWSLWRIAIDNQSTRDMKIIPIFHHDDGRNLVPTARHIWDALRETKDFVLMHCFSIVPKLIKNRVDLMKVLLSLHSRRVRLPDFLVEYLLESLTKDATFETWPLTEILPSRESFLRFLQGEWKAFLAGQADPSQTCRVPFSHEDVRVYIDTFFIEGSLTPVEHENVANLPAWAQTGVVRDPRADAMRRFRGLWRKFEAEIPREGVSHREWQQVAERWAELVVLRWEWDESLEAAERVAWRELQTTVEDAFAPWMMLRYGSLHNLPYHQQPVMVHQIPRFMAVERTRKKISKMALLVLDGLAFDQWLLLKRNLEVSDKAWRFRESTAFAWVPTLTS